MKCNDSLTRGQPKATTDSFFLTLSTLANAASALPFLPGFLSTEATLHSWVSSRVFFLKK